MKSIRAYNGYGTFTKIKWNDDKNVSTLTCHIEHNSIFKKLNSLHANLFITTGYLLNTHVVINLHNMLQWRLKEKLTHEND